MSAQCAATVIAGRLRAAAGDGQPFPGLLIRALDRSAERLLAEGLAGPRGEFSLELPFSGTDAAAALEVDVRLRVDVFQPPHKGGSTSTEVDVRAVLGGTV